MGSYSNLKLMQKKKKKSNEPEEYKQSRFDRHGLAKNKYRDFEDGKYNNSILDEMIRGEKKKITLPKTGEFFIVKGSKTSVKNQTMGIPLNVLLDSTKSYSQIKSQYGTKRKSG